MTLRTGAFKKTALWFFASSFIVLTLSALLSESAEARQRNNRAFASVAMLKSRLLSSAGFQIEAMRMTDTGAACIQYSTRDASGTMREQAVVVGDEVARSGLRDGKFEEAWNRQCLGQAYDVTDAVDHFF